LKRYSLTQEVLKKQGIKCFAWQAKTKTPLSQVFEALAFGSFLSFYLAMLNSVDPSRVPWVDYFKKNLK
jgi:hypothetical protein